LNSSGAPDWDLDQLEVIMEEPTSWQLVVAGPGAGKSAVACQRIAFLIDGGMSPTRILLVSFTRTAVAELRDRIVLYAVAGERARTVRISTLDSHAWSLRTGFDDDSTSKSLGDGSYDLSIARAVELFRSKQPDLFDFMSRLEHLIIDEAQDVMGIRAELVLELLTSLPGTCGVTILADPAQAIYGFTTDSDDQESPQESLLSLLEEKCPRELTRRELKNIHRVKDENLMGLFLRTRQEVEQAAAAKGHVSRVQQVIREASGEDYGTASHSSIADLLKESAVDSMLVLFRTRADVLIASSYCSNAAIEHRLRMSGLPIVVRPWVGWVLGDYVDSFISREQFVALWESRAAIAGEPMEGEDLSACWDRLHQLSAGSRPGTVDLVQLRRLVSRSRPPMELCYTDLGTAGPILGTIHASKGREADTVVLVMPPSDASGDDDGRVSSSILEEGRVYYVGATRARKMLVAVGGSAPRASYLDGERVFRRLGDMRAQLEVGRDGDVDRVAHLSWSSAPDVQRRLASCVGRTTPVYVRASAEHNYARRIILEQKCADGVTRFFEIGQMSDSFDIGIGKLWGRVDLEKKLRPAPEIRHLYVVAIATVGLSEAELGSVKAPFNQSGLALAPVLKGFPMIQFLYRRTRRRGYE